MEILNVDTENGAAELKISRQEVEFLLLCVNEVCNGVDITEDEFETRLGYPRASGAPIMDLLTEVLQRSRSNR